MVTIIIPFYNSEKYIEQCLRSVQKQTYRDIEILCISDGSEDASDEIVRNFSERDPRFRLICQPRANAGQARNTGIKYTSGEYMCFLDSDDFLAPDMIEKMINKCEETQCDICLCDADDYQDGNGKYIYYQNRYLNKCYMPNNHSFHPSEISDFIFQASTSAPWGKLFRTEFIKKNRIGFHEIQRINDIFFVSMQIVLAQQITFVAQVLVHHRVGIKSNLQNGHHETPMLYSYVIKDFYRELHARKIFNTYERSFLHLVVAGNKHIFGRLPACAALDDFIKSCKKAYEELNFFEAFVKIGKSYIETSDNVTLDVFLDYVTDLYSLKQMNIYDDSLETVFMQTVNILKGKYIDVMPRLPLNDNNQKIGFYGIGKHTQGLLAVYEKLIEPVKAEVIYITTDDPSDYKDGIKRISYNAIDDSFDAVVVSSYIYNDEMIDNLSKICSRTRIISFYPQYKRDIFAVFCEKGGLLKYL